MTAPPSGNWECDTGLRRVVRVRSLDLGVTMGKERLKSREGLRTPNGAYETITAHGPPRTAGSITARWGRCRLAVPKSKSRTKATGLEVLDLLCVRSGVHLSVSPATGSVQVYPFLPLPVAWLWPHTCTLTVTCVTCTGRGSF